MEDEQARCGARNRELHPHCRELAFGRSRGREVRSEELATRRSGGPSSITHRRVQPHCGRSIGQQVDPFAIAASSSLPPSLCRAATVQSQQRSLPLLSRCCTIAAKVPPSPFSLSWLVFSSSGGCRSSIAKCHELHLHRRGGRANSLRRSQLGAPSATSMSSRLGGPSSIAMFRSGAPFGEVHHRMQPRCGSYALFLCDHVYCCWAVYSSFGNVHPPLRPHCLAKDI